MTDSIRSRTARALLLGALLILSAGVSAREARLQGPNGDGGTCPEVAAVDTDTAPAPAASKRAAVREKPKATPMSRGGSGGESTTRPRWHSILPGMFR